MFARCLTFSILLATASRAPAQNLDLAVVDQQTLEAMKQFEVPGAALVIVSRDRPLVVKGYGFIERGKNAPVNANTTFPMASCTKSFTSAALAMLVDEKKVAWDDPVRKHLADFRLADPNASALVTLRDLLCHRTGLSSHDYLWYRAAWSQEEMIRRAGQLPLSGQFRSSFAYQSIMFVAAGKVVGGFDAKGWDGFVRSRLLTQLEMKSTATTSTEAAKNGNLARGHKRGRMGKVEVIDSYPMPEPNPAGSIHTTARDLATWLQFQLGDGTWRGKRLISADALAETHRPQNIIPGGDIARVMSPETVQLTYGMGWVISDYRGVKLWSHAGLIDGFRCHFTLLPDQGVAIGIMNNLHATRMNLALSNRLVDLMLDLSEKDWYGHYLELQRAEDRANEEADRRRAERRKQGKLPSLPLASFAGRYEHPAYGEVVVKLAKDRLRWEWSSFKRDLLPFDTDIFELRDVMVDVQDVTFVVEDKRITKMKALGVEFVRK